MSKLHKACRGYESWKAKNSPQLKPWVFPEQNTLPRINMADISSVAAAASDDDIDETDAIDDDGEDSDVKITADEKID